MFALIIKTAILFPCLVYLYNRLFDNLDGTDKPDKRINYEVMR